MIYILTQYKYMYTFIYVEYAYQRKMYCICPSDSKIFWLWQFLVQSFFWKCPDFILLWLNKTLLDKCITSSLSIYMLVTFYTSLIHTYYDIRAINSMYKYLWDKTSNPLSGHSSGIAGYLSKNVPYWFHSGCTSFHSHKQVSVHQSLEGKCECDSSTMELASVKRLKIEPSIVP